MSFLYPAALALAAAIAVPLFVHLRKQPTQRRVPFPAVRYLRQAERSRSRALRTRDLLLMSLRVSVVVLAALAAAGPLVGRGGSREHRPTDVAIVLDNSASTGRLLGDRTVFEALRELALQSAVLAGPADRFWILPLVGPPLAVGVGGSAAADAVRRAESADGHGDVSALLSRALQALPPTGDREREVHLLWDLQASGVRSAVLGPRIPVIAAAPPDRLAENGVVAEAIPSEGFTAPRGAPLFVDVFVRRYPELRPFQEGARSGGAIGDSARVRIDVDGETVDASTLSWGERATLRMPALEAGAHYARVELEPAGLRSDDTRHLAFRVVEPPRVQLVSPETSFLGLAVETLREAGRTAGPREGGRTGHAREEVRIVEFDEAMASTDPSAEDALAVIYIPPEDPLELPRFNQLLTDASVRWSLTNQAAEGELGLVATGALPPGALDLRPARVLQRYLLRPAGRRGEDTVLVRTSDGEPWIVRGRNASSRYMVIASPLRPSATSLPTSPLMVPLVERLLYWSVSPTERAEAIRLAGETVDVPTGTDSVRTPDGRVRRVDSGSPLFLQRAGLYRLYRKADVRGAAPDGSEIHDASPDSVLIAANVPAEEHDPRSVDPGALQELLPGLKVVTAGAGLGEWSGQIFLSRRGRDAAAWLAALVGLLILLETLVTTPRRQDRAHSRSVGDATRAAGNAPR